MPSVQDTDQEICGQRFNTICKPPSHPQGVCYDKWYQWPYMGCHPLQMSCAYMGKVSQAWDVIYTWGCPPSRSQTNTTGGQDSSGSAIHQAIPGGGAMIRYQWPYIGCHPLQMSCGCMAQASQAWDVIHTWGCPPSRTQTPKTVGQDSTGSTNHQSLPMGGFRQ